MTTITINRAVVEQAYEALWYYHATEFGRDTPAGKAIAAFHAALAQQAEPVDDSQPMSPEQRQRWEELAAMPQQVEPVEPVAHRVVAGALFDFMGWLTSRRERLVLSSTDDAAPAADAIKDFAEMRGLSMNDAQVKEWQDNITAPPQRKPLTDEKISDLWCEVSGTDFVTADTHVFARAVERAHNITDPQIEDRLARHGIPMPGDPK